MPIKRFDFFNTSLGVQIAFVTAICVLLSIITFGTITAHYQSDITLEALRKEANILSGVTADSAQQLLLFKNFAGLEEKMLNIAQQDIVYRADIIDSAGKLYSSVIKKADGTATTDYFNRRLEPPQTFLARDMMLNNQIVKWQPFTIQNEHFWVRLVVKTDIIRQQTVMIYQRTFYTGIAASFLSFILLMLFLQPRLQSIRKLTNFAATMEAQSGKQIEVEKNAAEITELNQALNNASTRLQIADEHLRDSEYRLRKIVEHMPIMMIAFDHNGNIIVWNKECERVTGFMEYEIRMNPLALNMLFESKIDLELFKTLWLKPQDFYSRDWVLTSRNGDTKTIAWSNISRSFPIPGWSTWGIGVDISQRVEAEYNARRHRDDLAHASRVASVGELASGLAHEINQPLSAITNYASCGLYRLAQTSENNSVRECLNEINKQAKRAGKIVNNLQHFMRKKRSIQTRVNLKEIINQTYALINSEAEKNNVSICISPCIDDIDVNADAIQITQVILNIIINAIESMHDARSTLRVIHISSQTDKEQVLVSIADSGPGLNDVATKNIFQPFYSTKEQGMGLGLSISTSIIESHGGKLWFNHGGQLLIDNEMIKLGCTFSFSLPVYKVYSPQKPSRQTAENA